MKMVDRLRPSPFFWAAGTILGFLVSLLIWGWLLRPDIRTGLPEPPPEAHFYDQARRGVHVPEELPVVQRDVDYEAGREGAWWPKGESPMLRELVEEGHLPPVEERVGPEPLVLEGVDDIGNYGGTWVRLAAFMGDSITIRNRLSSAGLVRWSPMGYPVRPHLARGWSVNEDRSEWTFYLRRGVRWSDGHPFTAGDILYWWEKERNLLFDVPEWMTVKGEPGRIVKVDDYTVRFEFPAPYGMFLEVLAGGQELFSPRHYLEPYHPKFGDQELIEDAMRVTGLLTPRALYSSLDGFRNPEYPRMWPWIYRTHRVNPPEGFVRNPYFWAVDPEGNQLPYVDRILFEVRSALLLPIAAATGFATMQDRGLRFDNYTMLMEGRESGDYEVYHWYPATRSDWQVSFNITRRADNPVTEAKAEILRERDFRRALSLAIDRQAIIDSLYHGVGKPAQPDPGPGSPFESEKFRYSYVDYDPDRANALLDGIGLTRRDREGMRTLPDGTRLTFFMDFTVFTGEGPAQFVVDDWAAVGIRVSFRERGQRLFFANNSAGDVDMIVWTGESEFHPLVEPRTFAPVRPMSNYAIRYAQWFLTGGLFGAEDATGLEPPPGSPARENMERYVQALSAPTQEERVAIFQEMAAVTAEEVWSIGISTPPPALTVVQNGFRNVPRVALQGWAYATPANTGIETYFFDEPRDSPGALAQMKREMIRATPARGAFDPETRERIDDDGFGQLMWRLVIVATGLALVYAGVRHPFIGRRLIILVPTLLIMAVCIFMIIQAPPGDFIETRIMQLEATGDREAIEETERLRELFHLEEPLWKQFLRWIGVFWFFSFDSSDKGLLQGEMGRSMDTQRSVNEMVGERIMLTFWVSLGTILFTWLIALPIGIYSAVRQYSVGDYVLSFIGFIGMCLPNFLFAILIMYWADRYLGMNVSGLFSPEYATAPEWTWGKVVDLLKHIWVPIVVIATAGTAGMIRVMRGNLLDELKKPYVTTARAKGVRPFKLLVKYPVRLALNPFISGVGGIFPQLVSGGAIVAIVLSLPMVGPLLLDGLMLEDVYVAASMLMVLSVLGVIGTLVSDLLLLWLDPRIRFEGGSR